VGDAGGVALVPLCNRLGELDDLVGGDDETGSPSRGCGRPSNEVADYSLEEAGVAVLPGSAFGAYGEGYLRLCFANSVENIGKALERMAAALVGLDLTGT